ncbi:MAG: type II toxin-antitoxin system RelE/ParE family toxin [Proteobacteria bacterium]|nr:type II toxin-antitoxin system RelE/ParE family toxin [Pseudomonadota bacterium]
MTEEFGDIVWSLRARRDLESIRAYIGQFAPLAAQRFALKLVAAVESLAQQPERGRQRHRQVRELVIIRPYIVRYRLEDGRVVVLRIRHGARRPD